VDASAAVTSTSVAITFSDNVFIITEDPVQVAGRPQAMNIAMWTNDGANCFIDTNYNYNPQNLEASINRGGVLPGANDPNIGAVTIPDGPAVGAISFDFSVTPGQSNFVLDTNDVGQYTLTISDTTNIHSAGVITGSSAVLTVRPFGIAVTSIMAGATVNPGGTAPADVIFTSAGSNFEATVAGVLWSASDDTDSDGVLDAGVYANNAVAPSYAWDTTLGVSAVAASYTPSPGTPGVLNNSTVLSAEFGGGSFAVTDLQYTEVGSFTLVSSATAFLGEPTADIVGDDIVVGRFIPASFVVTINGSGILDESCSAFTYIGEDFSYSTAPTITVIAQNALGATTVQYRDAFVKLNGTSVSADAIQDDTTAGSDTNPLLVSYTPAVMPYTVNNDGTVSYTFGADTFRYGPDAPLTTFSKAANSQVAPFVADINPEISTVSDGEVTTNYAAGTYVLDPTGNNLRFGRLRMDNVFGPELNPLLMPVFTEFWNGTSFQKNILDTCTTIANADLIAVASPPGLSVPVVVNAPASAGDVNLSFPSPGAGNDGFIDTIIDLNSAAHLWLRFDWDVDGVFDNDPFAQATFGIFDGNPVQIYIQQIYE
jgi:MSHA biogenesis protein MshQ